MNSTGLLPSQKTYQLFDADITNAISNNKLPLEKADEFFTQKGIGSKPEAFTEESIK